MKANDFANVSFENESKPNLSFEDEVVKFVEYRELSIARRIFFIIGCVLTFGVLLLVCNWFPRLFVLLNYHITTPNRATKFIVIDDFGTCHICNIISCKLAGETFDYFEFKKLRYRYDQKKNRFAPLRFDPAKAYHDYHNELSKGIDPQYLSDYQSLNGINSIEVPVTPLYKLILDEGLHPFIVFQIFSIVIWCLYLYYYYAIVVGVISFISVIIAIYETKRNMHTMKNMTAFESHVKVYRRGQGMITISSKNIVPGDIFELRSQTTVPCDVLLLSGNCLVNEMMLTGESIPLIKTALPYTIRKEKSANGSLDPSEQNELLKYYLGVYAEPNSRDDYSAVLDIDRDKVHILYGGTKVVRARNGKWQTDANIQTTSSGGGRTLKDTRFIVAIAVRTGFSTAKGQLVRSILFPRPTKFSFYKDSFKFISVLAIFALIGFIANAIIQSIQGGEVLYIILKAGDLVTQAVPPTLPIVMSAAISYALARLKKKNIFCINPQRVNVAGKIRVMCFDKTGTLTEDDLDVHGVQEVKFQKIGGKKKNEHSTTSSSSSSSSTSSSSSSDSSDDSDSDAAESNTLVMKSATVLVFKRLKQVTSQLKVSHTMTRALASCHTLAKINGTYVGDPMDIRMLLFSGWRMVENLGTNPTALTHSVHQHESGKSPGEGDTKVPLLPTDGREGANQSPGDDDDDDVEEEFGRLLTEKERHEKNQRVKRRAADVAFSRAVLSSLNSDFLTPHCAAVLCPPEVTLEHPHSDGIIALHRRFDFLSHLQRMSVICRRQDPTAPYEVFVKGSPEMVSSLCMSHTIPSTFKDTLSTYTRRGLRVLALAHRTLTRDSLLSLGSPLMASILSESSSPILTEEEIDRLPRGDVETDLTFLGFLVMENKLRRSTPPVIERLNNARIKPVMVTGDNALTAVNVARNCGIVPSYIEVEGVEGTPRKKVGSDTTALGEGSARIREIPIFLAEVTEDGKVIWRCTDDPMLMLDPDTLYPQFMKECEPPSTTIIHTKVHLTEEMASLTTYTPPSSTASLYHHHSQESLASETVSYHGAAPYTVSLLSKASNLSVHLSQDELHSIDGVTSTASTPPVFGLDSRSASPNTHGSGLSSLNGSPLSRSPNPDNVSGVSSVSGVDTPSFVPERRRRVKLWTGGPWAAALYNQRPLPPNFPRPPKLIVVNGASSAEGLMTPALCSQDLSNVDEASAPPYFLAMSGSAFRVLKAADRRSDQESSFKKAVFVSSVFARMSPDDKASLVESFIDLGFVTGMCGDGANDCGALKAAHVGVSLSEVEASIAAPFTSKVASIECVEMIILDGRASLATSFQAFKATATFSMIQLSSSLVLLFFYTLLADFQYLMVDIFITLPFLFSIGNSRSSAKLTLKSPIGSLISFPVIGSLISHTVVSLVLQVVMVLIAMQCNDFVLKKPDLSDEELRQSSAVSAVFLASIFHYLCSGIILSLYDPFLEKYFLNKLLVPATIFVTAVVFFLTFVRLKWFDQLLLMDTTEDWLYYRWQLITSLIYFVVLLLIEYTVWKPNLPKRIHRHLWPRKKLVGKIKAISEKEKQMIVNEELCEREKQWQRARQANVDHVGRRDEVLLDPTQSLEHNGEETLGGDERKFETAGKKTEMELQEKDSEPSTSSSSFPEPEEKEIEMELEEGAEPSLSSSSFSSSSSTSSPPSPTPQKSHRTVCRTTLSPQKKNRSSGSNSGRKEGEEEEEEVVFTISEEEKKKIYNSIPTLRKVFRKPFYALLALIDAPKTSV